MEMEKSPIILSHRGYSKKYKENTKKSIEKSLEHFNGVEIDLRITKDNNIILIHDKKINNKWKVKNYTLNEILQIDHNIYSFENFLKDFDNKFKYVNIDIKNYIIKENIFIKKVIELINKYNDGQTEYIISSFKPSTLNKIKNITSKYKLALLISKLKHIKNIKKVKWDYLSVIDTLDRISEFDKNKLMVWSEGNIVKYRNAKIIIQKSL